MKKMTNQEMMEVNGGDMLGLAACGIGVAMGMCVPGGQIASMAAAAWCYGWWTAECATEAAGY